MTRGTVQRDSSGRWAFSLSLGLHVAALVICNTADFLRPSLQESTPYYVDIVSLPDSAPAPAASPPVPAAPLPPNAPDVSPDPIAAPRSPAMALPVKRPQLKPAPTNPAADQQREQESREFAERMGRLERNAEARHQSEALALLQKRVADKKGGGAAAGTGIDKGADYGAYIQSRLKDALGNTMVYRSKSPETSVHLYIDKHGKLLRYVMVSPSPDKLFNNSVVRTIEKAKKEFPPVPSGRDFDKLYVFSPQEVKN